MPALFDTIACYRRCYFAGNTPFVAGFHSDVPENASSGEGLRAHRSEGIIAVWTGLGDIAEMIPAGGLVPAHRRVTLANLLLDLLFAFVENVIGASVFVAGRTSAVSQFWLAAWSATRPRCTLARMSSAFAVQMNGFGWSL